MSGIPPTLAEGADTTLGPPLPSINSPLPQSPTETRNKKSGGPHAL
jgi:hypothetical protein